ncbi:MAG: helix-turn-helix domain-containing protein [Planctomycetota bacterium]
MFPTEPPLTQGQLHLIEAFLREEDRALICVADVAEACGLPHLTLNQRYKRATGKSLKRHLLERRIGCVEALLAESRFTLVFIAHRCGFVDVEQCRRHFYRCTGRFPD